jgi:hypothetical protein
MKEYNKYEQSQIKQTQYNTQFTDCLFQTVQKKLSKSAQRLLLELYGYRQMPLINPSQKRLASQSGYCLRHIRRAEKELKENNLIAIRRPHGWNRRLIYTFTVSLMELGKALRPIISALFLSTQLLLCDVDAQQKNVPLLRYKELLRIIKTIKSKETYGSKRGDASFSEGITEIIKTIPKKGMIMSNRRVVSHVLKYVDLSEAQLFLLDQYTDGQIENAMQSLLKKGKMDRPDLYLLQALRNIVEKQNNNKSVSNTAQSILQKTSIKQTDMVIAREAKEAIQMRVSMAQQKQLEHKMSVWKALTEQEKIDLYKDYTCNPKWSISWRSPETFFKEYQMFNDAMLAESTPLKSQEEQLKDELENAIITITKVSANKERLISEGMNASYCDTVIDGAKPRAHFCDNELKRLRRE